MERVDAYNENSLCMVEAQISDRKQLVPYNHGHCQDWFGEESENSLTLFKNTHHSSFWSYTETQVVPHLRIILIFGIFGILHCLLFHPSPPKKNRRRDEMTGLPFLSMPMSTTTLLLAVNGVKRDVYIHSTQTQLTVNLVQCISTAVTCQT
jgi:hypothetical protein